jgi:hypothetical protein
VGGKSKKITVGYRYKMGLHFSLCRGPVDSVEEIIVGERTAWTGPVDDDAQIYIDAPELFGGDKREGGILGDCDIMFGRPDQGQNDYLVSKLGALLPAFRGVVSAVFRGGRVTSNNPYVKPWWFRVERILTTGDGETEQWYAAKAPIALPDVGERELVSTTFIEIDSQANAATTASGLKAVAAVDLDGLKTTDVIELYPNYDGDYIAWSQYGTPAYSGGTTGSIYNFEVIYDDAPTYNNVYTSSGQHDGYEAARAEFAADAPITLTGHSRYRLGIIDDPINDNSGGISLIARAYRTLDYQAMNPAHIIRECLTDPYMRMAYPESMIDDDSFTAAADTFYDEGMGLCLFWSQQTPIKEFIQLVLDHCGAVYYADPYTGKFVLTPIRGDYDPDTLDVYDESSIISVESFQRAGLGEVVNEITVVYTDVVTGRDASITVQDNAAIQSQGYVVGQTKRYPGLPTATLANRVAQRDLTAVSQPLAQLKVRFTRAAWGLRPGGVIKLSWAKLGITELVCRVLAVDYGNLDDGVIVADLAEDVFGLPETSFQEEQPTEWEAPNDEPEPMTAQDLVEAPYWDIATNLSAADLDYVDQDAGYVLTLGAESTSQQLGYNIYSRIDPAAFEERAAGPLAPTATIDVQLERDDTDLVLSITDMVNFDADTVEVGSRIMVGSGRTAEFCEVTDVTDIATGTISVNRGILDTTPGIHPAGTRVWLFDDAFGEEGVERATNDVVDVKLVSFTGADEVLPATVPPLSIELDQRFYRPYPPGNLQINGESYPTDDILPNFTVSWAHRDRLQQTATYITQSEASIGPEAGTTYNVYMYDADTDALQHSETGINDDELVMPHVPGAFTARIEVEAVRDGIVSWQRNCCEFSYIGTYPLMGALLSDSAATSLTEGAATTTDWDTEEADDGGLYDAGAPSRLTAPAAGWYVFSTNLVCAAGAANWHSDTQFNLTNADSTLSDTFATERSVLSTLDQPRSIALLDRFQAGGYVTVSTSWVTGTGSRQVNSGARLSGARVYSSPPFGAMARRTTTQSINTATTTTITFDEELLDDGGMFSTGSGDRITIPTGGAGWYIIVGRIRWPSTSAQNNRSQYIEKNSSGARYVAMRSYCSGPVAGSLCATVAAIEYLADADYVRLLCRQASGSPVSTPANGPILSVVRSNLTNQHGCILEHRGTSQTVNAGSDVLITFDTEVRDDGGMADLGTSSSRIYAQVDGYYAIVGHIQFAGNTGTGRYGKIVVDGTTEIAREGTDAPAAANGPTVNPFAVHYLTAGQYVSLYANTGTNTSTANSAVYPRLAMVLLSEDDTP